MTAGRILEVQERHLAQGLLGKLQRAGATDCLLVANENSDLLLLLDAEELRGQPTEDVA